MRGVQQSDFRRWTDSNHRNNCFSVKTIVHIRRLFEKFGFDKVFGRSAVMTNEVYKI